MSKTNTKIKPALPDWKLLLHTIGQKGIVRNIPFMLYCSVLAIIYITMNHVAENTIRDVNRTAKSLKEARWKYIDLQTQIMFLTKESQIEKPAAALGLEKTKVPPYKINVITDTKNDD